MRDISGMGRAPCWRSVAGWDIPVLVAECAMLWVLDLPSPAKSGDWDGAVDLHYPCTDAALAHVPRRIGVIGYLFGAMVADEIGATRSG
ncbi:hypothetical protein ROLI_007160 [Roseobacter fucihabitans]|uniref:Uncharacterized protein n=1 Tax=Roseobacter fucihabitans TaxID=1537242 RepID=A0ABZ2BNQ5_9RHOB|nr:hypothetical protein [Roseobacter litoralis]MBC6963696.1 hypothetical protein [Roseobacter litoralis]